MLGKLKRFIRRQLVENSDILSQEIFGLQNDSYDLKKISRLKAALDSAEYCNQHMSKALSFKTKFDLLTRAMTISPPGGLILEFGVASGNTINHIARQTQALVYGFDSFEGLPEDWRTGYSAGRYAQNRPTLESNIRLIEGLFDDTLPGFVANHSGDFVSLAHIDCDLYTSTKTVLEGIKELLRPGSILVFDEYFNYPGWQHHEFKALRQFCSENGVSYTYDAFVPSHQQVCIRLDTLTVK